MPANPTRITSLLNYPERGLGFDPLLPYIVVEARDCKDMLGLDVVRVVSSHPTSATAKAEVELLANPPLLTAETASAYIVSQHDESVAPCNIVETSEHDTIDGRSCIEVTFWYNGWKHTADVWVQDGKLYGEW